MPATKRAVEGNPSPPKKKAASASLVVSDEKSSRCINTIRVLSADMVEKANSGHPGAPMGCAPIAHLLWTEFMRFSPSNPKWPARDRFVLSNGHACALQYSMLHLCGYDLSLDDLKKFRQLHSRTPGHPENTITPGIEVTTGPLGSGISNAVGLAIAERNLAATFNKDGSEIVDNFTYVICGDGCLQEGVASEACSLAGHLGLGRLIVCYDDNRITIDGDTSLSFTEDVNLRFEAYGWHVQTVDDVNDLASLREAIVKAKDVNDRPSLIKIRTVIGQGSKKEGSHGVHGSPLGAADIAHVKELYGFDPAASFVVPEEVRAFYSEIVRSKEAEKESWDLKFTAYCNAYPELACAYTRRMNNELPENWTNSLPSYDAAEAKSVATRNRSEEVLNALAHEVPELIGGSADLTPSNLTNLKCSGDFQRSQYSGRYIRFGVREHGMAAICNGIFAYGFYRPFCATFLNFMGYALGSVRLSAISEFGVIYIMTHDSIGLGEDGPTHQPVEMLSCLRAIPNLLTLRPADGRETNGVYTAAMKHVHTPSVLSLSRQAAPAIPGTDALKTQLGAYVIAEFGAAQNPASKLILASSGTEVLLAFKVAEILSKDLDVYIRVVSMPCMELFDQQSLEYKLSIFPNGSPVMSIEAGSTCCWKKYAHASFGIDEFGHSAPTVDVFNHFGFTEINLVEKAKRVLKFFAGREVLSLMMNPIEDEI